MTKMISMAACVLLSLGGCSTEPPEELRNASASIACRDFRNAMSELSKGILTDGELRQRMQRVHENARLAMIENSRTPPDGFSESAETMLRIATQGSDAAAFNAAVGQFSNACREQSF